MNTDEFYDKLKETLKNSQEFPGNYTFKFIIPNSNKLLAELQIIFDQFNPIYSSKLSKGDKYLSLTVKLFVLDEDYIIEFYKKASKIENIMML